MAVLVLVLVACALDSSKLAHEYARGWLAGRRLRRLHPLPRPRVAGAEARCRVCGTPCAGTFCGTLCWEVAKMRIERGGGR